MVIHDSIWKYEVLYKLLMANRRFEPLIVVIPHVTNSAPDMENLWTCYRYFHDSGYKTITAYDDKKNTWVDIRDVCKPDIVFFTNPHNLSFKQYSISYFINNLTCYVPYAFVVIHLLELHYNQEFHHCLWKHFVETEYHREFAGRYIKDSKNVTVTGYPGLDLLFSGSYAPINPWKNIGISCTRKIIWAPHHSIEGQGSKLDYSNFLEYADFFISFLENNKHVQIAFKPHPLLKAKLNKLEDWGIERTNRYYEKWSDLKNGQLEEGAYLDLFYHSDGMILDSASFIVEYLYFNKPILFALHDDKVQDRFNDFGKLVFDVLYTTREHDIMSFINEIVVNDADALMPQRERFLNNYVLPKNGKTASMNIYEELNRLVC